MNEALLHRRQKAAENLAKASRAMKARYDRRRRVTVTRYKVGDLVLWCNATTCSNEKGANRNLINKYDGPYRVAKVIGNDRYVIMSVKGMRVYSRYGKGLREIYSTTG
ncbi:hypothetical protein YQE_05055, partial [Dendroctonus ponderosae]